MSVVSVVCRFHMVGDHGALTCSHLQSYDPDRALTDYISRLEALQRRLGSVTSGNTYKHLKVQCVGFSSEVADCDQLNTPHPPHISM